EESHAAVHRGQRTAVIGNRKDVLFVVHGANAVRPRLQVQWLQFRVPGDLDGDGVDTAGRIACANLQVAWAGHPLEGEAKTPVVTEGGRAIGGASFVEEDSATIGIDIDARMGCRGDSIERLPEGRLLENEVQLLIG